MEVFKNGFTVKDGRGRIFFDPPGSYIRVIMPEDVICQCQNCQEIIPLQEMIWRGKKEDEYYCDNCVSETTEDEYNSWIWNLVS